MIFPCPTPPNRCEDSPTINLTSEDKDGPTFLASYFGNGTNPFLGTNFRQDGGVGFCTSLVSQSDADICSFRHQLLNQTDDPNNNDSGNWTDPQGNPYPVYGNQQTAYTVFCPDGTPFVFTVPAGRYVALSQIEANRIAASFARLEANLNRVCLGTLSSNACYNSPYSSGVLVSGRGPFTFSIFAGGIPPGLGLHQSGPNGLIISGTPTSAGTYTFTLQATNAAGYFMRKDYTIRVLGFTETGALPQFTQNEAYSHQMAGAGGVAPYSFSDLGSLPPGLTLSATGLLSGTPTDSGDFSFSLAISDSSSPPNLCSQDFTLHGVNNTCAGPNWDDFVWTEVTSDPGIDGSASAVANQGTFAISISSPSDPASGSAFVTLEGHVSYTGPAVTCKMRATFTNPGVGAAVSQPLAFYIDGVELWHWDANNPMNTLAFPIVITNPLPNVYDITFQIPLSVASILKVSGVFGTLILLASQASPGSLAYSAVYSNVC